MRESRGKADFLVAAAGNDGMTDRFYPAFSRRLCRESSRSGRWIRLGPGRVQQPRRLGEVYAQGSDVVNGYPKGTHVYGEAPHGSSDHAHFDNGMAEWIGDVLLDALGRRSDRGSD